jgi:5-methylthioadenosine/S-adenosylhomocysteine deaminase
MKNKLLITNALILPMTERDEIFTGSIGIVGDKIEFVSREQRTLEGARVIDAGGKVAMPGLVNAHNHISMALLRSYADDLPLMTWLTGHVWPFEAKMRREDVRAGAELGMAEMLLGGTTTSADMYWMDEAVAEAAEKAGIRAVIGTSILDGKKEAFDSDFAALQKYVGHPRITLMVAPHAPYTCSPETLEYARNTAEKANVGLMIHVSETADEQKIIAEKYHCTPVELLRDLGLLTPRTLVIHGVFLSEGDIAILHKHGCSVAHNPQSNMKLASGIAPVAQLAAAGVNVSIGTDGPASNNDLDMWEELRAASLLAKVASADPCALSAWEVLHMATAGGAKALGLEGVTGELREGLKADIILVDVEKPHYYPRANMVANLAYCGKAADVETVIVDGRVVVEGRKLLTLNVSDVCREADRRFADIVRS